MAIEQRVTLDVKAPARFISKIESANEDESEAIKEYFELLELAPWCLQEAIENSDITIAEAEAFIADINKIIADEREHRQRLSTWSERLSMIAVGKVLKNLTENSPYKR